MKDLEHVLPDYLKRAAVPCGTELVLPYLEALDAVAIATEHLIAVLGVESFEVLRDGLQVIDYSGYDRDILFAGDWRALVIAHNSQATCWIREHRLGENHGYILTSASQKEFTMLPHLVK